MTAELEAIDAQIDAVRAELYRRVGCAPLDARGFTNAWRRHPVLRAREKALFRARYDAQVRRDKAEWGAARKAERAAAKAMKTAAAASRCPTCGFHTLDAA